MFVLRLGVVKPRLFGAELMLMLFLGVGADRILVPMKVVIGLLPHLRQVLKFHRQQLRLC